MEKITKNYISNLSFTKCGHWLNQLKKILEALSNLCQDRHYNHIPDIISTNTKLTQEHFLSDRPIKRRCLSKYHVKLRFFNSIIGIGVPSGNSSIDSEIVENTPIFNSNLQEQSHLNYNQKSNKKSKKWDKLITDKKSVINIILD